MGKQLFGSGAAILAGVGAVLAALCVVAHGHAPSAARLINADVLAALLSVAGG